MNAQRIEELICLRVVGLILEPHEGEAEADGSSHCWGWETGQALTHCLMDITQIAREIPGKRNHAGYETKA